MDGRELAAQSRDAHLTLRRVERQQLLIETLAAAPVQWSTTSLADHLRVGRRTVERDLARLREAGVPIETRAGRGGGAALVAARGVREVELTVSEIAALLASLTALGPTSTESARTAMLALVNALRAR